MTLQEIPWGIIAFIIGQLAAFIWFLIGLHFKTRDNKQAIDALEKKVSVEMQKIEKENQELKKELKDMRDILVKVENNTHLLMLGRIKTSNQKQE